MIGRYQTHVWRVVSDNLIDLKNKNFLSFYINNNAFNIISNHIIFQIYATLILIKKRGCEKVFKCSFS
jgi:hypothetical protein